MQIVYVTETWPPEVNGVALTVERTVRHLRERGHGVLLVRPRQRGEPAHDTREQWCSAGAPLPMYPDLRFGLAFVSTLRQRLRAAAPQLVHVATPGPLGRAAVLAARSLRVPVTTDFRTHFHRYSRYYRLGWLESAIHGYLRGFHNRADCTFVPTRELRDELERAGFEHVEVVARGVDTQRFTPALRSEELRAQWGVSPHGDPRDEPVLLYVGRLAAEKNVRLALRSFAAVRQFRPRARMVVVGDGPLRARLRAEFPEAIFAGVQRGADLARCYASADVFVFPSLSETFGNVTLEALASGLAVVAFDAAAAGEHIHDGRNGLLVAPDDEAGFIAATYRATAARELLPGLREQARQSALRASWDSVLQRFEHRLLNLATGHDTGRARHVAVA